MKAFHVASAAACALLVAAPVTAKADQDPIRYIAANCTNCHATSGRGSGGMPSLAGLQTAYIAEQMRLFRDGKRPSTVMHQIAKGYSEQQIERLADYFGRHGAK